MMWEGAAKTGLSWMREGKEEEEEGEEGVVVSVAKTEGRNVAFLREVLAGEIEERHQPFMEEVDIVQWGLKTLCYIALWSNLVWQVNRVSPFYVTFGR